MRLAVVPSTPALLPAYASIDDPIGELRAAVAGAVTWLAEEAPVDVIAATPTARRIGDHLLAGARKGPYPSAVLVVANGSARRTEKAPGHFDERAPGFDAALGAALAEGDAAALRALDAVLAEELWCHDVPALRQLTHLEPSQVHVDYSDDPYGVQYWVVRWEIA